MHGLVGSRVESGDVRLGTLCAEAVTRMVVRGSLRTAKLRFVILCVFLERFGRLTPAVICVLVLSLVHIYEIEPLIEGVSFDGKFLLYLFHLSKLRLKP